MEVAGARSGLGVISGVMTGMGSRVGVGGSGMMSTGGTPGNCWKIGCSGDGGTAVGAGVSVGRAVGEGSGVDGGGGATVGASVGRIVGVDVALTIGVTVGKLSAVGSG